MRKRIKYYIGAFLVIGLAQVIIPKPSHDSEPLNYPRIRFGKFYMCKAHDFPTGSCTANLHTAVGDSSLPNVNKKFLFVVYVTTDSLGRSLLDRGAVTEASLKNAVRSAGNFFRKIGIECEAEDSIHVLENTRFDLMSSTAELEENAKLNAKQNRINLFIIDGFDQE